MGSLISICDGCIICMFSWRNETHSNIEDNGKKMVEQWFVPKLLVAPYDSVANSQECHGMSLVALPVGSLLASPFWITQEFVRFGHLDTFLIVYKYFQIFLLIRITWSMCIKFNSLENIQPYWYICQLAILKLFRVNWMCNHLSTLFKYGYSHQHFIVFN